MLLGAPPVHVLKPIPESEILSLPSLCVEFLPNTCLICGPHFHRLEDSGMGDRHISSDNMVLESYDGEP